MDAARNSLYQSMSRVVGCSEASRVLSVESWSLLNKLQTMNAHKALAKLVDKAIPSKVMLHGGAEMNVARSPQPARAVDRSRLSAAKAVFEALQAVGRSTGEQLKPLASGELDVLWSARRDVAQMSLPLCFNQGIFMRMPKAKVHGASGVTAAALQVELQLAAAVHTSSCEALHEHVSYVRIVGLSGQHFEQLFAVRRCGVWPLRLILAEVQKPNAAARVQAVQACTRDAAQVLHGAALGLAALHDRSYSVGSVSEDTIFFEQREGQLCGMITAEGARGGTTQGAMRAMSCRRNVCQLRELLLCVQRMLTTGARNPPGALQFRNAAVAVGNQLDVRAALFHLSVAGEAEARRVYAEQDTLREQLRRRQAELLQEYLEAEAARMQRQREMQRVHEEEQRRWDEFVERRGVPEASRHRDMGMSDAAAGVAVQQILGATSRVECAPRPAPISQARADEVRQVAYAKRQRGLDVPGPRGKAPKTVARAYMHVPGTCRAVGQESVPSASWSSVLTGQEAGDECDEDEYDDHAQESSYGLGYDEGPDGSA